MFANRTEAGRLLTEKLKEELGIKQLAIKELKNKIIVLGIPRGGMVVAKEVTRVLGCPLDVVVTRKIGAPGNQELAIGAVGETEGSKYIDERLAKELGVSIEYLGEEIKNQKEEIKRREKLYRRGREPLNLENKIVVLVDDGVATGATMIAAIKEVWNNNPKRVIAGLPVCPKDTLSRLEEEADQVIVLETPEPFFAVGQFYREFEQVSDEQVIEILRLRVGDKN